MWVPYRINGGINQEDPDILLAEGQVRTANNMVFERGTASIRPGTILRDLDFKVSTVSAVSEASQPILAGIIQGTGGTFTPYTVVVAFIGTGALYRIRYDTSVSGTATWVGKLGGAWTAFAASYIPNAAMASVNASVLICTPSGIKITYQYSDTAADVVDGSLAAVKWNYIVGHLSRAVVARLNDGATLGQERYVGWSITGDPSNFYGPGSGRTLLADANTAILGLGNIRGTIAVAREDGFHLGNATGAGSAPFNWIRHSEKAPGLQQEHTLAFSNDRCFYVSHDDVYTFDLVDIKPIGMPIRRELLKLIKGGLSYRGSVTLGAYGNLRTQYHLIPYAGGRGPHFTYDLLDGTWSRHDYPTPTNGLFFFCHPNLEFGAQIAFLDGSQVLSSSLGKWDEETILTREAFLTGRSETLVSPDKELSVNRVMLIYRNNGTEDVTLVLTAEGVNAAIPTSQSVTKALPPTTRWTRILIDLRVQGSFNSCDVRFPYGGSVDIASLWLDVVDGGDTRNA